MARDFAQEWDEIQRIDNFLFELRRSVTLGELTSEVYDTIAARHLLRRAELVAAVSRGMPQVVPAVPAVAAAGGPSPAAGVLSPVGTFAGRPATEPKPVPWTTVLIFLGAFLVIVAAGVFALVAWKMMGTVARLAFLGSLTAGFYAAGWWVRQRLKVPAGWVALMVVGSAMLLFDGWIVIDGYSLEGPLPWAVLLLVCSLVYWLTEMLVAERYFGAIGAAAQLAWWWLLGDGLGWSHDAILAGMAIVAVAWRLAADRGRDDKRFGSLALVMEFAAPVAAVLLVVAFILSGGGSGGWETVAFGAIVSAAAAFVVRGSRLLDSAGGQVSGALVGALMQVPLLSAAVNAMSVQGGSWGIVAVLVAATLAYETYAVLEAGTPFFIAGLIAEAVALGEALDALGWQGRVPVVAFSLLAVAWTAAAVLARKPPLQKVAVLNERLGELSRTAMVGSLVLLVAVSIGALSLVGEPASPVVALVGRDVLVVLAVLMAWAAVLRWVPSRVAYVGFALFAGYAGASVASWLTAGDLPSGLWVAGPVAGCAAALLTVDWARSNFSERFAGAMRWAINVQMLLFVLIGLATPGFDSELYTLHFGVAAFVVAAVLAVEARAARWLPAAFGAGVFAVGGAAMVGSGLAGDSAAVLGGCAVSVSLAWIAAIALNGRRTLVAAGALASVASATLLTLLVWPPAGIFAVASGLVAIAWVSAAYSWHDVFTVPAGFALFSAVVALSAHIDRGGWVTVSLGSAAMLGMCVPALTAQWGRDGEHPIRGAGLALSGMVSLAAMLLQKTLDPGLENWLPSDEHMIAAGLLALAVAVLVVSIRWRSTAGLYVGWLVVLLAVWTELSSVPEAALEWYTTSLAIYLVLAGFLYRRQMRLSGSKDEHSALIDAATAVVGLGVPLLWALIAGPEHLTAHALWVAGLSIVAIVAGVAMRVRSYFFGGVASLAAVAMYRSLDLVTEYWWVVIGVLGIAMLTIAVTWEQQRETRGRLVANFRSWR